MLGFDLLAIIVPNTWTGSVMTFQASADGTNFFDLYDSSGGELQLTVGVSTFVKVDPSKFAAARYLKVRCGTAAAPSSITATLTLIREPNS